MEIGRETKQRACLLNKRVNRRKRRKKNNSTTFQQTVQNTFVTFIPHFTSATLLANLNKICIIKNGGIQVRSKYQRGREEIDA